MNPYVHYDGYVFVTRRTVSNVRYLKCKGYATTQCKASGKIVDDSGEFIPLISEHNHPRLGTEHSQSEFRKALRQACLSDRGTPKEIYSRVALLHQNGAVDVPYNTIRQTMYRWKRSTTPNIPVSLVELATVLQSSDWSRYSNCSSGTFFSGIARRDGYCAAIFGNPEFVNNFGDSQHAFVDATFKVVPSRPPFCQILTIFATSMDHAFPVIHVLMERRSRTLYDAVFEYVVQNFANFINNSVVTDFEAALVESLRASFPRACLHGCYFHYCQAIFRKAKQLGIIRQIRHNIDATRFFRRYYVLALLPATQITAALETLETNAEFSNIFRPLNTYMRRQWISRVTPQHFSAYRQVHRTNNIMESYHRRLNSKLVKHPGIWDLIETLIDIQNIAKLEHEQLLRGHNVYRIAKKTVVFDRRMNQAWDKLATGQFTLSDFFRQTVHLVESLHNNLDTWTSSVTDPEEDEDLPMLPLPNSNLSIDPPPLVPLASSHFQNEPPPLISFRQSFSVSQAQLLSYVSPPNSNHPIYFQADPQANSTPTRPSVLANIVEPEPQTPAPTQRLTPSNNLIESEPQASFMSTQPSTPTYNFPPIPATVARLFASWDDDNTGPFEVNVQHQSWQPLLPVVEYEEEMGDPLKCKICLLNKVQYFVNCGHIFCATCAATIYSCRPARCGICRAELTSEPLPIYFN